MSRKDKGREVDFETPEVTFETPKRETKKAPTNEVTHDAGCWCGKRNPGGCTGSPVKVIHLGQGFYQYVCPFGRDKTCSIPKKVFEAAVKAGLVSQEEKHHG